MPIAAFDGRFAPAPGAARLLAAAAVAALLGAAAPPPESDSANQEIERRLSLDPAPAKLAGESIDGEALRAFYAERAWRPAWSENAEALIAILASAGDDGLAGLSLHLAALHTHAAAESRTNEAESDILLTDALLRYAYAMRGQRVDPADIEDDWLVPLPPFDAVAFLEKHVDDAPAALADLQPHYEGYQALRAALAALRAKSDAGFDWPKVPAGPTIHPGATDDRVAAVRRRLVASEDLAADKAEGAEYDSDLQAAVALFQRRHGLADDGLIGARTVAAMNVGIVQRERQIALNMERWRWLPGRLESRHILVNVPGEWLDVVEDGHAVLSMRTIVGDLDHPTPVLRARLNSLVLNPVWRVPADIATEEILPELKKNPRYLVDNDLELVSSDFSSGSPESQGAGINWNKMTRMPWPVRQLAGSDNALGKIKFNLPNDDDIYLHDTPNHKLFDRSDRALSHGCVRVENAEALALYLLRDKGWTQEQLDDEIAQGDTETVPVPKPVPVWLLYWTAWIDADGAVEFRDDLYDRDQHLAVALNEASRLPVMLARATTPTLPPVHKVCDGCRLP